MSGTVQVATRQRPGAGVVQLLPGTVVAFDKQACQRAAEISDNVVLTVAIHVRHRDAVGSKIADLSPGTPRGPRRVGQNEQAIKPSKCRNHIQAAIPIDVPCRNKARITVMQLSPVVLDGRGISAAQQKEAFPAEIND